MKKWILGLALGMALLIGAMGFRNMHMAEEVAEMIERHGEAMGGKKHWAGLKSYQKIMKKENGVTLEIKCLLPDVISLRFEKEDTHLIKAYDGKHGYIVKNGIYQSMRKGEAKEMAEEGGFYSELIFALDRGYELEFLGNEKVENINCHKISVKKSDVDEQIYWLNKKTYLIEQTGEYSEDSAHKGIYYKTRLENYQSVEGFLFPFKQTLIPGDGAPIVSTLTAIKVNIDQMKKSSFSFEPDNTANLIRYWKDRYWQERLHAFTFEQETIRTKKDGSIDTSIWYEAIQYPDYFRMDFGDKSRLNRNLYRNDSLYVLRKGDLVHSGPQVQEFMIMEGSVYDFPVDSTLSKLTQVGTDHSIFHTTNYRDRKTYVIGAKEGDHQSNQVWLDAEMRISVRRFNKNKEGKIMEAVYDDFKFIDGHYVESWIEFFLDGELMQTERYNNIEMNPDLPEGIFDPGQFEEVYWY